VTVQDVRLLVEAMNFVDENMTACVGVTAPNPPPGKRKEKRPISTRYIAPFCIELASIYFVTVTDPCSHFLT
jgi:hypothetical protein